jgi:DinB superfamily
MASRSAALQQLLSFSHNMVVANVKSVSLEEMLFVPEGGYRSMLGTLKHIAGWSAVYRSYAFDEQPRHWQYTDWPRGLRDTIDPSQEYVDEVAGWFERSHKEWLEGLGGVKEADVDNPRRLHWGDQAPLPSIIAIISNHHSYHAGEMNQILSIKRGEAWEDGEEVEENHISTVGHRVKPPWKN